jgi:hypothetical protein
LLYQFDGRVADDPVIPFNGLIGAPLVLSHDCSTIHTFDGTQNMTDINVLTRAVRHIPQASTNFRITNRIVRPLIDGRVAELVVRYEPVSPIPGPLFATISVDDVVTGEELWSVDTVGLLNRTVLSADGTVLGAVVNQGGSSFVLGAVDLYLDDPLFEVPLVGFTQFGKLQMSFDTEYLMLEVTPTNGAPNEVRFQIFDSTGRLVDSIPAPKGAAAFFARTNDVIVCNATSISRRTIGGTSQLIERLDPQVGRAFAPNVEHPLLSACRTVPQG